MDVNRPIIGFAAHPAPSGPARRHPAAPTVKGTPWRASKVPAVGKAASKATPQGFAPRRWRMPFRRLNRRRGSKYRHANEAGKPPKSGLPNCLGEIPLKLCPFLATMRARGSKRILVSAPGTADFGALAANRPLVLPGLRFAPTGAKGRHPKGAAPPGCSYCSLEFLAAQTVGKRDLTCRRGPRVFGVYDSTTFEMLFTAEAKITSAGVAPCPLFKIQTVSSVRKPARAQPNVKCKHGRFPSLRP
uniref:Uncharacterized protein n=1 Tax=Trichuris muris TaxID=70415 RepID=A0A5S6QLP5_TRIMR